MSNEHIVSIPPCDDGPFNILLAGITYETPNYRQYRDNSPHFIIEYVISGVGHIEINGTHHKVVGGDMYILPTGSTHLYYSDTIDPWRKIWINAKGRLIEELLSVYGISDHLVFKNASGLRFMQKILSICEDNSLSGYEINKCASAVFFELVCFLYECESNNSSSINPEAEKIKSFIDSNLDKNLSLAELSSKIYRSEAQTIRIFKSAYNQTPYDYLIDQRIERATLFLLNTGMSIKEIALRLGFYDEHYFSNVYKKRTGNSPSKLRKNR